MLRSLSYSIGRLKMLNVPDLILLSSSRLWSSNLFLTDTIILYYSRSMWMKSRKNSSPYNRLMYKRTGGRTIRHRQMDGCMRGCVGSWWMMGWLGGRMDRQLQIDRQIYGRPNGQTERSHHSKNLNQTEQYGHRLFRSPLFPWLFLLFDDRGKIDCNVNIINNTVFTENRW